MLTQATVESALLKWMEEFVEVPHPRLGGWPPCPFARQARLTKNIDIRAGIDPLTDCLRMEHDDWNKEVIVFWYDHTKFPPEAFVADVEQANRALLKKDIVALEDHPLTDEIISGVKMNFGYCAIIVLQKNSKLNQAADQLREKGYYHTWTQEDLDKIVSWRYK
jgi:hypothetical protein